MGKFTDQYSRDWLNPLKVAFYTTARLNLHSKSHTLQKLLQRGVWKALNENEQDKLQLWFWGNFMGTFWLNVKFDSTARYLFRNERIIFSTFLLCSRTGELRSSTASASVILFLHIIPALHLVIPAKSTESMHFALLSSFLQSLELAPFSKRFRLVWKTSVLQPSNPQRYVHH